MASMELTRIGVYGVGHFGYALLRHLEGKLKSGLELRCYDHEESVRRSLQRHRQHPIDTTETPMSESIRIVDNVVDLVRDLDALVLAVTSNSTREVVSDLAGVGWRQPLILLNTAKALDYKTGRRLSEIITERMDGAQTPIIYAALAGGTIASDLLRHDPLGVTIACEDEAALGALGRALRSSDMWVQTTRDVVGVECAGAFKNVISICAGMVHGLGHSYGSETHLISRMASEVAAFCIEELGADSSTFGMESQCWGNDLWMSCTGSTRNRALGELLGKGSTLEEAASKMATEHKTVEGVQTLRAITSLLDAHPASLPLLRTAAGVILHGEPPQTLIAALMEGDAQASRAGV